MSKKKKQTPAKEQDTGSPKKQSFERRSLRFMLKLVAYMFFLLYLGWAGSHAATWAQIKWVQRQPIEKLTELAPELILAKKPGDLHDWVQMRPKQDLDRIMEILKPYTGEISPLTFALYAERLAERNEIAEAVFWYQFALYRMRFDALRCGEGEEAVGVTMGIARMVRNKKIIDAIQRDPELLPLNIRAVLDMDAEYPARNVPDTVCEIVKGLTGSKIKMLPEQDWAWVRHSLRNKSELGLKQLKEDMQKAAQRNLHPLKVPDDIEGNAPENDTAKPVENETAPENETSPETP